MSTEIARETLEPSNYSPPVFRGLCGSSPAMQALFRDMERAARSDQPVLIAGERGTGKEHIARMLHRKDARRSGFFIALNCGAIAPDLLEEEIFGSSGDGMAGGGMAGGGMAGDGMAGDGMAGGLYAAARGGTLFLDNISELNEHTQMRLLHALDGNGRPESRENRPPGAHSVNNGNNNNNNNNNSTGGADTSVRLIAASEQSLQQRVDAGEFNAALFRKLSTIQLTVPPLRARKDDVLELTDHFLQSRAGNGQDVPRIEPAAADALAQHDWPGNVSELRRTVLSAAEKVQNGRPLQLGDLPAEVTNGTAPQSADRSSNGAAKSAAPDVTFDVATPSAASGGWSASADGASISDDVLMMPFTEARALAIELFDKEFLTAALARHSGNIARTARSLGLHRQSLQKLMGRRGIKVNRPSAAPRNAV